jgi:TetR/AcrR family transcriptional regulator, cholesterol catabolism regulator
MTIAVEPFAQDKPGRKRPRGRPRKTLDERDDGNRRHQLLQCAARLFRRKGFGATTTRDIAAAVGMHSGSPFYHFKSKNALLYAVMEEGMRSALERQRKAMYAIAEGPVNEPLAQIRLLVRAHFDVLLGPGNDFIPVMLYEARALNTRQRSALAALQSQYEAAWVPVLDALHASGRLQTPPALAQLLILGALNWSVQWFDRKKAASLEDLTDAAMTLFFPEPA